MSVDEHRTNTYLGFFLQTDVIILVSGDSDLLPPTIYSHNIDSNMKYHKSKVILLEKSLNKFVNCQMEDTVEANGKIYTIPEKWKKRVASFVPDWALSRFIKMPCIAINHWI